MTSALDWQTPEVLAHDPRGLAVRQIAYLRNAASGELEPFITRQVFDSNGHLITQRDARLTDTLKPNLTSVYGLSGQSVRVDSVDSGQRWNLAGLAGEILQRWNERDGHWRTFYDDQLRVVALEEVGQGTIETLTYATALADPNHNLRGQLIKQDDSSGELKFSSYSLLGQMLRESRTITDAGSFHSSRTYSPLGTVLTQTDAGDHQQRMKYDITGQLQQVQFRLTSTGNWQLVLEDARYNAAGQIIEQQAGNKVVSHWTYDEVDGRLETLTAGVPGQNLLQHFQYGYDRVGNLLRIDDLAFKPMYFRNQLIDGHREFSYNSLYQLTSATGHDSAPTSDLPGRPAPSDPTNHFNYKQIYTYDPGGNLIKLVHERALGSYTHQMFIDPNSNRGVRWKEGDPAPVFDTLFDPHGNLNTSSPGRPLHWDSRDQLASATLVERDNGPNDEETYHYSQGVRVLKRHEWQASTLTHFHQVIYLPGLEIRTRDNGEELHVITLPGGRGSVRCLHWANKKPDGIDQDQLRYSLDDHLGSSLMELDQNVRLISHEGYYPFGGTAWLTAVSALEASYKTIRYSGKEMDECGLYYYGARYYAPWLQRWVSADPAGYGDGPNLYAFVGNSPLRYFDANGEARKPSELRHVIVGNLKYLSVVNRNVKEFDQQLDDLSHPAIFRLKILKNFVLLSVRAAAGFFSAWGATTEAFAGSQLPNEIQGLTLGNSAAGTSNSALALATSPFGFNTTIVPHPSDLDPKSIRQKSAGQSAKPLDKFAVRPDKWVARASNINTLVNTIRDNVGGAILPGVSEMAELYSVAKDANRAEEGLLAHDLNAYDSALDALRASVIETTKTANTAMDELGEEQFYANSVDYLYDLTRDRIDAANASTVSRSTIQRFEERALDSIDTAKLTLARYRTHVANKSAQRAA